MTATDIVSFSERPFEPPCADPAVCGSEWSAGTDIGTSTAAVMCTRCGRSGTIDLDLGDVAVEPPASETVCVAYTPSPVPPAETTVRHVEHHLGADGVLRPTGRVAVVTYRQVVTACRIETGEA